MSDFAVTLEEAIRETGVERYRWLCSDANVLPAPNDRESYRRFIVERRWKPLPEYPPILEQAGNALGALGRVVAAAVQGQPIKVAPTEYYERLEICRVCEFNGERPFGVRCTKCGCGGLKLELATERCPIGKWERVTDAPEA